MLDRLILELLCSGHTVIFIVDEAPAALGEWQEGGLHTVSEEFALYRALVGDEVHQVPVADDQCDGRVWNLFGPSERCARLAGHEGECWS